MMRKYLSAWWRRGVVYLAMLAGLVAQPLSVQALPLLLNAEAGITRIEPPLEFLLDATGKLTIEQIEHQPALQFLPVNRSQSHLIENGALWLRFDALIDNPLEHWRLTLPLATVDEVTFFYRNAAGQWVKQLGGDSRPMSSWAQRGRYPVFSLTQEHLKSVRYYVQIRHTRVPFSSYPNIVSDSTFIADRQNEHLLLGIYFGLALLVITLALIYAVVWRDSGFGAYAAYITLLAGSVSATTGMAALYWWPETPSLNNGAAVFMHAAASGAGLWFVRTVTSPRRYSRLLDGIVLTLACVMPLVGILNAVIPGAGNFGFYNIMQRVSLVVLLVSVAIALREGDRHARWLAWGFLPILLAAAIPLLRNAGVIPTSFLTEYSLILGSAIEVPILFYGLHRRMSQRREPVARAKALRTNDPLTGLYATNVLLSKLRQSLATAERSQQPIALLLVSLSNLSLLQKQHGREISDRAMVLAAARIRKVAKASDTVARVGDNQFALLLEGPISANAANAVATKILASGLRHSNVLPDAEPFLFHIGVGHFEASAGAVPADPDACLMHMLQVLKTMNDGSGKTIRLVKL